MRESYIVQCSEGGRVKGMKRERETEREVEIVREKCRG